MTVNRQTSQRDWAKLIDLIPPSQRLPALFLLVLETVLLALAAFNEKTRLAAIFLMFAIALVCLILAFIRPAPPPSLSLPVRTRYGLVPASKAIGAEMLKNLRSETHLLETGEYLDWFDVVILFHRLIQGFMTCTHYLLTADHDHVFGSNIMFIRRADELTPSWCHDLLEDDLRLGNQSLTLRIAFSQGASYFVTERKYRPYYMFLEKDKAQARLGLTGRTLKELLVEPRTSSFRFPGYTDIEDHVDYYNNHESFDTAIDRKIGYGIRVTTSYEKVYKRKQGRGYQSFLSEASRRHITGMVNVPIFAPDKRTGRISHYLGVYNIDLTGDVTIDADGERHLVDLQSELNRLFNVYLEKLASRRESTGT